MKKSKVLAILSAILAAVFYALNAPLSKILLQNMEPAMMAACLYLGAGVGVGILAFLRKNRPDKEEQLGRQDIPYTIGMIVLDIVAPVLLMTGLAMTAAANVALLNNFEIVATTLIALCIFQENVSCKFWFAVVLITIASALLTFEGASSFHFSKGSLLVILAASCWGLENNCTRKISSKDTYEIVILKGIFSGLGSLAVALITGEHFPEMSCFLLAMLLGFVAYGLSIFFYIRSQSVIGAAKTSAYYALAPFIGAFLSFMILKEPFSSTYAVALCIMAVGTAISVWDTMS